MTKSLKDYSHLCGWVPPETRTDEQNEADAKARGRMPRFALFGHTGEALPEKVVMTDLWDSEEVQGALGFKYPGTHQITGSCVGAAGGDVLFTTLAAEVLVAKEAHKIIVPYWLLPYGKSRSRAGMRGKGEGSFGTTFADACRLDGVIDAAETGLPAYKQDQGLVWGRNAELAWSDGNAIDSKWLEMARHNIIGVTTIQESADNVKIALANWYPHTIATSHYCHPDRAKVKNGLVTGQFDTRGPHQTKILGYFQHPDMGDMFYNVNNWGNVYPKCPLTGRQDGCWIDKKQMSWAVSQREVIAFASMTGFMARTFKYKF